MNEVIVWTLKCVSDQIGASRNSMEVFGYDFMIDDNYKPWLLEINSSPSFTADTPFDKKIKFGVVKEAIKLIYP